MSYHQSQAWAVGLLFVLVLGAGCSGSVGDVTSPTGAFWDRRPCVAGARQPPAQCEPPREFVQRQAPPVVEEPSAPFPRPQAQPAPAPRASAPPSRRTWASASVEDMRVLDEVNRVRAQHLLRPLRFQPALWIAARDHSGEQDRHRYMGHGSPDPSRRELAQRMAQAGYRGYVFAEVVAWGYPDVPSVVEGWMNSTEHRRILLDSELTEAAFSRSGEYWTGNFGAPSRSGAISSPRPQASAPPPRTFQQAPSFPRAAPAPRPQASVAPTPTLRRAPAPLPQRAAPRPVAKPAPAPRRRAEPSPVPQAPKPAPEPAPRTFSTAPQTGFG